MTQQPNGWTFVDTGVGMAIELQPEELKAYLDDQYETATGFEYIEDNEQHWFFLSVWDDRAHVYRICKFSTEKNQLDLESMSFDPKVDQTFSSWIWLGKLEIKYTIDDLPFADPEEEQGNESESTGSAGEFPGELEAAYGLSEESTFTGYRYNDEGGERIRLQGEPLKGCESILKFCEEHKGKHPELRVLDKSGSVVVHAMSGRYVFPLEWKALDESK